MRSAARQIAASKSLIAGSADSLDWDVSILHSTGAGHIAAKGLLMHVCAGGCAVRCIEADLGAVIIKAGQNVVHKLEVLAGSVRQYEAGTHDRDLCVLNLQHR